VLQVPESMRRSRSNRLWRSRFHRERERERAGGRADWREGVDEVRAYGDRAAGRSQSDSQWEKRMRKRRGLEMGHPKASRTGAKAHPGRWTCSPWKGPKTSRVQFTNFLSTANTLDPVIESFLHSSRTVTVDGAKLDCGKQKHNNQEISHTRKTAVCILSSTVCAQRRVHDRSLVS
jgi:hypothetical protein